ncbi:MAG: hypothetical protein ABWY06_17780 [Pseudomonas sp.]|uniref:hypothetical protein n=1 Tax=Pseudomonas sp. TaxID=306 RepID=UPI003393A426
MNFDRIDIHSAFVPIGYVALASTNSLDNEENFLAACLRLDEDFLPCARRSNIEAGEISETIRLIVRDLQGASKFIDVILEIEDVVSATVLGDDPNSAGKAFLIRCKKKMFYINWFRAS